MTPGIRNLAVLVLTIGVGVAQAQTGGGHSHEGDHAHHATGEGPKAKNGKKWATDAPLRTYMAEIRFEVGRKVADVHQGKLKDDDYVKLSGAIDKSIQSIFKNCKLAPEADAALHGVLAQILAGSTAMKNGPQPEARAEGFLKVVKGLDAYGQSFDDSSWKGLAH